MNRILFLLIFCTFALSETILIPEDYATIQEGIDASVDGDTVLVSDGTYYENINFNGKNIDIIGEDMETTIIDGGQNGSVVIFENGEDSTALLSRFTLTNGWSIKGGGIYCENSSPSLLSLIIAENIANYDTSAGGKGGGIYCSNSSPILEQVSLIDNYAFCDEGDGNGGGIFCENNSNLKLNNIIISGNTALYRGGGIRIDESSEVIISKSTITGNSTGGYGGGIYNLGFVDITNSILWNNSADNTEIGEVNYYYQAPGWGEISYSLIDYNFGLDNIFVDPQFTDPENGDYTLQEGSPCIDTGTADIDGDGVDDITDFIGTAPDMGAFEFGESSEIMAGDTNFDGIVDILDIVRIINQIMGNSEFDDDEFTAADFNADGIVDILDIVQIVNYILP